jgi:protease-4
VASDLIWRELMRAKEKKKPIVVSMSDLAGSGGYFVALPGDKIFAEPGSITTSIGVVGGKMNVKGLYDKLGMSFGRVEKGENASMFSALQNYEPAERARMKAALDRIYMDFTNKVAEARGLEWEAVDAVGRGRVFTGAQALERGLIDKLGGMEEALAALKELAEIPADASVRLEVFPKPVNKWELLLEKSSVASGGTLDILREHVRAMQEQARLAARAGGVAGPLRMPVVEEIE